jgi:RNA polymerase sigma-70 factor (ECF subfamily)
LSDRKERFEQTVLTHLDAAFNLARWLTRNDHDAQDVVQEAVLRAYRFFDGLRGDARPWLLAIVRNSCLTWLQVNRPAEISNFDDHPVDLQPIDENGPEIHALRNSDRRMLNEAISALPAQFREVLVLRELEDLAYKDIARIADVPIGTVMSRLSRARGLLAESLKALSHASQVHR